MEILNQVTLAGNLTDKPSVNDAGGRVSYEPVSR